MCGRYGLYDVSEDDLIKENAGYEFKPNYNVAPTQKMPVIIEESSKPKVKYMEWGICRRIGPDIEKSIFNTRSEKAFERFWGKTVKNNRCLVPANGFYEWQKTSEGKQPYWIHLKTEQLMYFAGIFDIDSEGIPHYSIMTTSPNSEMERIHNRMPVILRGDSKDVWLTAEDDVIHFLEDLLQPLPDNSLAMYGVSKDVNYVKNNNGDLLVPVNSK